MTTKELFSERLIAVLDHLGIEKTGAARKRYLSKLMGVTERQAGNYLSGAKLPTPTGMIELATSLRVNPNWLIAGYGLMLPLTPAESDLIANMRTLPHDDQERLYHICESFQRYHVDPPPTPANR